MPDLKNRRVVTGFLFFAGIVFLFRWFYWDIADIITPLLIWVPTVLVCASAVILLIASVVYAAVNARSLKRRAFAPLLVITATVLLYLFFPFTKLSLGLNFRMHDQARNEVVSLIEAGELRPRASNPSFIALPEKYQGLSKGGGEVLIEDFTDHDAYLFYTFRGVLNHYSGFVYDQQEDALTELGSEYYEVEKLGEAWYYCASR